MNYPPNHSFYVISIRYYNSHHLITHIRHAVVGNRTEEHIIRLTNRETVTRTHILILQLRNTCKTRSGLSPTIITDASSIASGRS